MTTLPANTTKNNPAICYTQRTFSGLRFISIQLNDESAARLHAYHEVVVKLLAAKNGWMISDALNTDADDAFLNAKDGTYNLVAMRHFMYMGELCEFRIQCAFSVDNNSLSDMTITLQDIGAHNWQDVVLSLDDAVTDIDAFIETINSTYEAFVPPNDNHIYSVSLSNMVLDDEILKSMMPNRAVDTIKIRGFCKNLSMNALITIIGSGDTCSANQYLDIKDYLKLSGQKLAA